mmetsp:Transcript_91078/g.253578  ORF Transcript_91078/g.253578 Transcript_91078/m.253578 type:complete len:428 (-) Transcript_91078:1686-2969(-)
MHSSPLCMKSRTTIPIAIPTQALVATRTAKTVDTTHLAAGKAFLARLAVPSFLGAGAGVGESPGEGEGKLPGVGEGVGVSPGVGEGAGVGASPDEGSNLPVSQEASPSPQSARSWEAKAWSTVARRRCWPRRRALRSAPSSFAAMASASAASLESERFAARNAPYSARASTRRQGLFVVLASRVPLSAAASSVLLAILSSMAVMQAVASVFKVTSTRFLRTNTSFAPSMIAAARFRTSAITVLSNAPSSAPLTAWKSALACLSQSALAPPASLQATHALAAARSSPTFFMVANSRISTPKAIVSFIASSRHCFMLVEVHTEAGALKSFAAYLRMIESSSSSTSALLAFALRSSTQALASTVLLAPRRHALKIDASASMPASSRICFILSMSTSLPRLAATMRCSITASVWLVASRTQVATSACKACW